MAVIVDSGESSFMPRLLAVVAIVRRHFALELRLTFDWTVPAQSAVLGIGSDVSSP